jgi:hypothetical protein
MVPGERFVTAGPLQTSGRVADTSVRACGTASFDGLVASQIGRCWRDAFSGFLFADPACFDRMVDYRILASQSTVSIVRQTG